MSEKRIIGKCDHDWRSLVTDCSECLQLERDDLQRQLAAAREANAITERELLLEKHIVERVWKALGISTYEQAKPLTIDEHVAELKKQLAEERSARERHLQRIAELTMLLAGNGIHVEDCKCASCQSLR